MKPLHLHRKNNGYTLVELMVALVLTSIATVGIYRGFTSITTANEVQEQVIELQQNLRIGLHRMIKEIRMAGYDMKYLAGAGFLGTSNATKAEFTMDQSEDGFIDTTISYEFDAANNELDRVENGTNDSVIQNVDALDFVYLDSSSNVTALPSLFRTVQIALVVRTTNEDFTYTDTRTYANMQGTTILGAQNDNFHRRLLTAEVKCRNMGLK